MGALEWIDGSLNVCSKAIKPFGKEWDWDVIVFNANIQIFGFISNLSIFNALRIFSYPQKEINRQQPYWMLIAIQILLLHSPAYTPASYLSD